MVPQSQLVTPPQSRVIEFADVQSHLRIDGNEDQTLIELLIDAATTRLEDFTDRKFISQVWDVYYQSFSKPKAGAPWWDGTRDGSISMLFDYVDELKLPFGPVQYNSPQDFFLRTYSEDGIGSVFDPDNYTVDTVGPRGRVVLKNGATWPTTILRKTNGIKITATYGYGDDSDDVPKPIKQALLLMVAKLYENRGDDAAGEAMTIPDTAQMLLMPYRHIKVGGC
jgi:hypothetical protein